METEEFNEYLEILNQYTKIYENSRYDRLLSNISNTGIADIKYTDHIMPNSNFRSYGTYRRNVAPSSYLVKINETYIDLNLLDVNYYNIAGDINYGDFKNRLTDVDGDSSMNYVFPGCVLSPRFATNGNEASLEDIFVEFGYEYIFAYNSFLLNYAPEDTSSWYFDMPDPEDENNAFISGSYEILPIGTTFINYDKKVEKETDSREETVEYDGTYCPTVEEILSGNLYIVIKSGSLNPKKIYFNNKYMPSLFINDDKYKTNSDQYIINEQLTLKLCDIMLHHKLGCIIKWDKLFGISNMWGNQENMSYVYNEMLKLYIGDKDTDGNIIDLNWKDFPYDKNIYFKTVYYVEYQVYYGKAGRIAPANSPDGEPVIQYGGGLLNKNDILNIDDNPGNLVTKDTSVLIQSSINDANISQIKISSDNTEAYITMKIYIGLVLIMNGYKIYDDTTSPPPIVDPDPDPEPEEPVTKIRRPIFLVKNS